MRFALPALVIVSLVVAAGCNENKKSASAKAGVLDVPTAPVAQYTPPSAAQPVITEAPVDQPMNEAVADASDSIQPAPAYHAPQRQVARKSSASSAKGARYTIKKGESLWTIAQAKYGDGNKWKKIAAANPKLDPNKVQAGQTITIP